MDNLTLISCSYNTPDVTVNMLKTFLQFHPNCNILISENSTDDVTRNLLESVKIPYINNKKGLHAPSVDILLDNVSTRYALLVDTDILFLKEQTDLFVDFKKMNLTLLGDVCGDRGGKRLHNRVHPWHCMINVENIKKNNIKFYDESRLINKGGVEYDVGSSFFEDIRKCKLMIGDIKGEGEYYKHYEGMSWRVQRYGEQDGDINTSTSATHNLKGLYEYGLMVQKMYKDETQHLDKTPLKYK